MLSLHHGVTETDFGSEWVDVSARGDFSQVDTSGSTIKNDSVNNRKSGCYGRLWVGGRHRVRDAGLGR